MTIASSSGLSNKEIECMVTDAEQYAEQDKAHCDIIEENTIVEAATIGNQQARISP
jgi:molecular chaperone DnaK